MKKSRREDNELYFDSCNGCIQGSRFNERNVAEFGVIALVVVIILIGMFIYAKKKK